MILPLLVPPFHVPPGRVQVAWIGNSFPGEGDSDGHGHWVQNAADEIEVASDGTVVAGCGWDEAGRCLGLYRDGQVGRTVPKAGDLGGGAWGWGTANEAVAVDGGTILVGTTSKRLLRFRWTPGDLDSATVVDGFDLPAAPVGLSLRGSLIAVAYADRIETRRLDDPATVRSTVPAPGLRDVACAPDGRLWALTASGVGLVGGVPIAGLVAPSALSFAPDGRLVVCEAGARQRVSIYDVKGAPSLLRTFGSAGTDLTKPTGLFGLRGAGIDMAGNLTVAMGFAKDPGGGLFLRSFDPQGSLRWSLHNDAFVDTFGFDPLADGRTVFSRRVRYDLDLDQATLTLPSPKGEESIGRPVALTVPPDATGGLATEGRSVFVRYPGGRRALYAIGQYGGGFSLFAFDPQGVAREAGAHVENDAWAWDVDARGDVWQGDAPNHTLRRYAFGGWRDGKPVYDWSHPQSWPWPSGWALVRRVLYDAASDRLILTGYLKGEKVETWGVAGATARRYDGWLRGSPRLAWSAALPRDGNGGSEGPITPESVATAGDYLFLGMTRPNAGKQLVHILSLRSGAYVGSLAPAAPVDGPTGWEDMPYAVQALRRKNGEYLVLVEEDYRGKNLLYRWSPPAQARSALADSER